MGKLTVITNLTLDGVMQAPGRPDEDERGGFTHGGWGTPYSADAMGRVMGERTGEGSMLLGRRTYQDFAGFWPHQPPNPFTEVLNRVRKYVASTTLREPLPWQNSTLIEGDVAKEVSRLKNEQDLVVLGSGALIRSLLPHGVIDEFTLLIHPLVLGEGQRLFDGDTEVKLDFVDAVGTTTGVVIATYRPAAGA
jgi:dihydrofolate reductase